MPLIFSVSASSSPIDASAFFVTVASSPDAVVSSSIPRPAECSCSSASVVRTRAFATVRPAPRTRSVDARAVRAISTMADVCAIAFAVRRLEAERKRSMAAPVCTATSRTRASRRTHVDRSVAA